MRVAVIGAGPAGMTAAHALVERGVDVDLYEAAPQVGGLARSIDLWGRRVDLGSHTFGSADPRVTALWDRLVGPRRATLPLRRGIVLGGRVLDYPPRTTQVLASLGVRRGAVAATGALAARARRHPAAPATAREAVERRFGATLTDHLFEPYCRKLWGRPSAEVDPAFASALFSAATAGQDTYLYPTDGTGSIWERMRDELVERGGRVHLGAPVTRLHTAGPGAGAGGVVAVETAVGTTPVDRVVSSLPLPLLVRALPDPPEDVVRAARGLGSRGTVLVFLRLQGAAPLGWTWLYDYQPHHVVGRVTDVAAWAHERTDGASVWSTECWAPVGGDLWRLPDESLTATVLGELEDSGILGSGRLVDAHVVRLPGTHPDCPLGTGERLERLRRYVDRVPSLITIGRHGRHGTPGVGDCMEMALDAADRIRGAAPRRSAPGPEVAGVR